MSTAFASVRTKAVEIAKQELAGNVRESNNYQAIKDLHLGQGVVLENRGERVDDYLINAGVSPATMVLQGELGAKMREWCGMFIYYCYSTALKQTANAGALPFRSIDLWSGPRLRTWAINYDIWQAQRYILNHSVPGEQIGGETLDLINQQRVQQNVEKVVKWNIVSGEFNAASVVVEAGDIFIIKSGHIGMAISGLDGGSFNTIEGNQSELADSWTGVQKLKRTVAECSLIFRI